LLILLDVPGADLLDTFAGFVVATLSAAGQYPIMSQNALVLMQTTPDDVISQLEKCLREVSTFEGVLEFHNEHFWAIAPGEMAGSLHVRVRRDADEQAVLAQVANKLAHLVPPRNLTIQIVKDDWIINSTPIRS
jgi:zinc transporter 6